MTSEPRFKIKPMSIPRQFLGEVFLGNKCVLNFVIVATDEDKAMARLKFLYSEQAGTQREG